MVCVENPVSISSDYCSQFSAGGEKYPDAIAMAMDDLNKRVWSVCLSVCDACTQEAYPHSQA